MADLRLKDTSSESRLFNGRALVAASLLVLAAGIVAARLVYLQVINHQHYTTLSHDNRVKLVALPPSRGLIFDRRGNVLAENRPTYRLEIVPEQVGDLDATLDRLAQLIDINATDRERFHEAKARKRPFEAVPLRFHLGSDEVARFAVNRHRFPGVDIEAHLARYYPQGPLTSHVVGYVGRIDKRELQRIDPANYSATTHIGKVGIERYYEQRLHGEAGHQQVETNAQGRALRVLQKTPPRSGENLHLTLDTALQRVADTALGDRQGAVVALDLESDGVLALVSHPGYDPNLFVHGIEPAAFRKLQKDPSRPLFNRATRGRYPPGSTIKPFVALAGLDTGTTGRQETTFCPGHFRLPGREQRYRCWKRRGHGHVNIQQALVQSCDVYFYDLASKLGIDRIHAFLGQFGFGSKTGIDLPNERGGLLPSRQWKRRARGLPWFPGETVIVGIGQGFFLTTPLELATATGTLAERGQRTRPHLLQQSQAQQRDQTGGAPEEAQAGLQPVSLQQTSHWDTIIEAMTRVVHSPRGTARRIRQTDGYRIAGKTGTAQLFGMGEEEEYKEEEVAEQLRDHALFVAFAPADSPRIAVAVVVENGGSGGATAAPIAGKVIEHYLDTTAAPTRAARTGAEPDT